MGYTSRLIVPSFYARDEPLVMVLVQVYSSSYKTIISSS